MHQNWHVHMAAHTDAGPHRCMCRDISAQMHLQWHGQTCIYISTSIQVCLQRYGNTGAPEQTCPHLKQHLHEGRETNSPCTNERKNM